MNAGTWALIFASLLSVFAGAYALVSEGVIGVVFIVVGFLMAIIAMRQMKVNTKDSSDAG